MPNALLLAELRNVNQSFLHAQILCHNGLNASAEHIYWESVAAMNRSMRLMLAMLADGNPIGFDSIASDDPLGSLRLETGPAAIFAAELVLLDRLLAQLWQTQTSVPPSDCALQTLLADLEAEHRANRDWLVARIEASDAAGAEGGFGEPDSVPPDGQPFRLDALRARSGSFHPAWAAALAAGKQANGDGGPACGRAVGAIIGRLLVLNEQSFVHAFLLRHWGSQAWSNRVFEFSIDAMRYAYVLCELALLRGAPASVAMPTGRDALPAIGSDPASALANERRGSQGFAAQIDGAMAQAKSDATLSALLAHMRATHRDQAIELAPSDAGAGEAADKGPPQDDLIAAMLVRWRIEDPTAAAKSAH